MMEIMDFIDMIIMIDTLSFTRDTGKRKERDNELMYIGEIEDEDYDLGFHNDYQYYDWHTSVIFDF